MIVDKTAGASRLWWLSAAVLCAALVSPLFVVDVLPLQDYANHLARLFVLSSGQNDPILSRFYVERWGPIPDLGVDILGVPLLHLLPIHVAGRVLAGIALLLPAIGVLAYSWVLNGRAAWPFVCGLLAYNQTFLLGFLAFHMGIGLALLFAAAWLQWREVFPVRTVAFGALAAIALFFCHLMGLLFFGLLIAAHEAAALEFPLRLRGVLRRLAAGAIVVATPAALYARSEFSEAGGPTMYLSAREKAEQLLAPVVNYDLPLDVLTGIALAAFPVFWLAAKRGSRLIPPRAALALAVLALLYVAAPFGFKGTFNLDTRFIVMFALVFAGGFAPPPVSRRAAMFAGIVFLSLFAARMAVLHAVWFEHRADVRDLRAAMAGIPPGATVFLTAVSPAEEPLYWASGHRSRHLSSGLRAETHMPALLVIERRAWWPLLFDNPAQQPIQMREPFRSMSARLGGLHDHLEALAPEWALCGFDYLLLIEADAIDAAAFAPDRLALLHAGGFAALYRVRPVTTCPE
jgi:hypothetical protein